MFVTYRPTSDDFFALNMFALRHTARDYRQVRLQLWCGRALFLALVLVEGYHFIQFRSVTHFVVCTIALVALLFFGQLHLAIYRIASGWQYKRIQKKRGAQSLELTVAPQNLKLEDTDGLLILRADCPLRIVETADYFFLQISERTFVGVPLNQIGRIDFFRDELQAFAEQQHVAYICCPQWVSNIFDKRSKAF